jgi:hypothetical protein
MIEFIKVYWFLCLWILLCITILSGGTYLIITIEKGNRQCKTFCIEHRYDTGRSLHAIYDGNCICEKYSDNTIKGPKP